MPATATRPEPFHYPWRDDNRFEVLVDGSNFLPRMLAAIGTARHTVLPCLSREESTNK